MSSLDAGEFERLFRTYHSRLCGFAYSYLHDREAAQEIVQELFLAIWQKRVGWHIRTSERAYLFRALRNRLANKSARVKLEQQWFQRDDIPDFDAADSTPQPDHVHETTEIQQLLRRAVESLPPSCRAVVTLRFQEEMSYAEIADALGIETKTVENHLARGRKLLRERLPGLID